MQTDKSAAAAAGTCRLQPGPPEVGKPWTWCSIRAWLSDTHKAFSPYLLWPLLSIHAIPPNNAASSRSLAPWLTVGVGALVSDLSLYLTRSCLSSPDNPWQDTIKGVCLPRHFPHCLSKWTFNNGGQSLFGRSISSSEKPKLVLCVCVEGCGGGGCTSAKFANFVTFN